MSQYPVPSPPRPERPGDESNAEQLDLARAQGREFGRAVEMTHAVARGAEQQLDDYRIGYAVEEAEGRYEMQGGQLVWREPDDENAHIEIIVRDANDGRFVPGLDVRVTLLDAEGREQGTHAHEFLWHPWLYHYGRNWRVPGSGTYALRVHIEPPDFPRYDRVNGRRYTRPVEVEFRNVRVRTGRR